MREGKVLLIYGLAFAGMERSGAERRWTADSMVEGGGRKGSSVS